MIACLKGKAHEWRLVSDKVVCRLCNARGTLQDLNGEIGSFYALRDERDELQATLDELRASYCMEITRSSNLEAEWDEALRRVVQLGAQAVKLRDERDSIASERDELQADLNAQKAITEVAMVRANDAGASRCETCRYFHPGTYTCPEWAPLRCVVNYYSDWEAKGG